MVCQRWCVTKWCVKDGVVKDGVWQSCVWKMVGDKVVCERWCVTKLGVKDGGWQSGVWKMVCDKDGIQNQKQERHTKIWETKGIPMISLQKTIVVGEPNETKIKAWRCQDVSRYKWSTSVTSVKSEDRNRNFARFQPSSPGRVITGSCLQMAFGWLRPSHGAMAITHRVTSYT